MRLVVERRPRQRSEHNGSPASRIRGIRAPTEGRVSRFSYPKIAEAGRQHNFSKLSEIKGYEVFRVDRIIHGFRKVLDSTCESVTYSLFRYRLPCLPHVHLGVLPD